MSHATYVRGPVPPKRAGESRFYCIAPTCSRKAVLGGHLCAADGKALRETVKEREGVEKSRRRG